LASRTRFSKNRRRVRDVHAMQRHAPVEKELYSSPNGDRRFLVREPETGRLFVRHKANIPSGGQVTDTDIVAFLSGGRQNPERRALLHLIESGSEGSKGLTGLGTCNSILPTAGTRAIAQHNPRD
jgi:hypothetical protein